MLKVLLNTCYMPDLVLGAKGHSSKAESLGACPPGAGSLCQTWIN